MKKSGFTLAEVLITLGIIGVVAALTAPALVQNTANAQVGPTLAKVVSTIENANQKILLDEGISNLSSIYASLQAPPGTRAYKYAPLLAEHIMGSSYSSQIMPLPPETHPDGSTNQDYVKAATEKYNLKKYNSSSSEVVLGVYFQFSNSVDVILCIPNKSTAYSEKGAFKGDFLPIYIDINGRSTEPNTLGKDVFFFYIDGSGSVVPAGGKTFAWLMGDDKYEYTTESGDYACNANTVTTGMGCAGSVLDNNRKVIYQ